MLSGYINQLNEREPRGKTPAHIPVKPAGWQTPEKTKKLLVVCSCPQGQNCHLGPQLHFIQLCLKLMTVIMAVYAGFIQPNHNLLCSFVTLTHCEHRYLIDRYVLSHTCKKRDDRLGAARLRKCANVKACIRMNTRVHVSNLKTCRSVYYITVMLLKECSAIMQIFRFFPHACLS